nr:outer dense fiber protein 4 isoform X1 [Microcebus murinus]
MECKTGASKMGMGDSRSEFPGSGEERAQHQRPRKEREDWKTEWDGSELEQEEGVQGFTLYSSSNRRLPTDYRRASVLPFQWRIIHSTHWIAQMLASTLSLVAFILLLVMIFSKNWLQLSVSRYYQRWPINVNNRIYTSALIMSMGLLHFCRSKNCPNLENEKENLKLWPNRPLFKVAKLSFDLTVVLGFVLTFWLHLPYLSGIEKLPSFGLIGTILSVCEATCIFSSLLLFPINLWIFELEGNLSIPMGWSYFIGWLVFVLYVTCAVLCTFNHKSFRSLALSHSSGAVSCSSTAISIEGYLSDETITDSSLSQEEEVLGS